MNDSIWFLLFIQVLLIFLNAVFASAEIAVLSINELKIAGVDLTKPDAIRDALQVFDENVTAFENLIGTL